MSITLLILACIAAAIGAWIYTTRRAADQQIERDRIALEERKYILSGYRAESQRMLIEHLTGKQAPHCSPSDPKTSAS